MCKRQFNINNNIKHKKNAYYRSQWKLYSLSMVKTEDFMCM